MIVEFSKLGEVREQHPSESIVLAGGVFDLMHQGHLDLFHRMKSVGEISVVAVSTDNRVRERKGPTRPVQDQLARLTIVGAVRDVDYVLLAPEPDTTLEVPTLRIMRALKPDIFMSSDVSWIKHEPKLNEIGTELAVIPRLSDEVSTTATIEKIIAAHS